MRLPDVFALLDGQTPPCQYPRRATSVSSFNPALLCLLMQRRFQSGVLELLMKRLAYGRG